MDTTISPAKNRNSIGFQNLILVLTLLLIFLVASRSPLDSDLWWHLQSGKVMTETGKPLLSDVFSYTRGGQVWVNHSWLSEVFLYSLYRLTGWLGISAWMGLMAVIIACILWFQVESDHFSKAGIVLLASVSCAPLWTPRPQFFSLVLLVFLAWLIDQWIKKGGRSLWITIPVFILWSNLHGGYILGILYLLACAAGLVLDGFPTEKRKLHQAGLILIVAIGGYLSTAVNPNGIRMWLIPFQTVGVGILRQFIQEWASPDFHSVESWAFAAYLILFLFCLARRSGKVPFSQLMPSLLFILMALYARRNISIAVVVSTPILLQAWTDMKVWSVISQKSPEYLKQLFVRYKAMPRRELTDSQKRTINLVFAGLLGLFSFFKLAAVTNPVLMEAFERKYYPENAVKYLAASPITEKGRLFNAYNWGGYIVWKNPDEKVFVDGRTDLFGDAILGEWLTIIQAGNGWQDLMAKWGITRIIIEPNRPLVFALPKDEWVEQYRDDQAVIFDRVSP